MHFTFYVKAKVSGVHYTFVGPKEAVAAALDERFAPGVKAYQITPKGARAICFMCGNRIVPGRWRFDIRVKRSRKLGDERKIHPECTTKALVGLENVVSVFFVFILGVLVSLKT